MNYSQMIKFYGLLFVGALVEGGMAGEASSQERALKIVQPKSGQISKNPVKICMEVEGLVVEPAENGVAEGKGHHHILFSSLPRDLSKPIPRKHAIHMVGGEKCLRLKLEPGNHVVIALFSYGDHVPYNPPIMDKILVKIEE